MKLFYSIFIAVFFASCGCLFAQDSSFKKPIYENVLTNPNAPVLGTERSIFKKHSFFAGVNLSFFSEQGENDFLAANIDLPLVDKKALEFSFTTGYFLRPLLAIGIRGKGFSSSNEQILVADFLGVAFNATKYKTQTQKAGGEAHFYLRNYMPMGDGKAFYMFSETSIYGGYKGSYSRATSNPDMIDERITTVRSDAYSIGLGVSSGITYFSSNNFAFELQLGTVGLEHTWNKYLTDNITEGYSSKTSFRDAWSILRMQFGFTYYFNLNRKTN